MLQGDRPVSAAARSAIRDAEQVVVSAVTFAEVGIKTAGGKLTVPHEFQRAVLATGARVLNLTPGHGIAVAELPPLHRDPFDRLLVAQAQTEGLVILTRDEAVLQYDVRTVRA
jgi:PIN domain nuclease of toxin-antitoxin system